MELWQDAWWNNLFLAKEMNFRIYNLRGWQLTYGWSNCGDEDLTVNALSPLEEKMPGGEQLMVVEMVGTGYFSFSLYLSKSYIFTE